MANINTLSMMPFDAAQAEIERRRRMAQMLQEQAQAPLESQVAPGGMVVPTSPVLGLAKLLQAYIGGKAARSAEQQAGELSKRSTAEAQDFLRSLAPGAQQPMSPDAALAASLSATPTESQPMGLPQRQQAIMGAALSANPQMRMAAQLAQSMQPQRTLQVDKIDPAKFTPQSVAAALQADNPTLLVPVEPKAEKPTVRPVEVMRGGKPYVINAATGEVIGEGKPLSSQFAKAPSGFRYTAQGDLEPIPGGPNDPSAPKAMPPSMLSANIADAGDIKRLEENKQLLQGFIDDISGEKPKLPLSAYNNAKYQLDQATSGVMGMGQASEAAVRYFELKRAVSEQVNEILNRAKGPQTDQDALRAQRQILDNLHDPKIVASGLARLQQIYDREVGIRHDSIAERNQAYGRATPTTSSPPPPPGFERPQGGR